MGAVTTQRQFNRRIIRISETCKRTGLSKSTLRREEIKGTFPRRVRLSERSSGHFEDEVNEWINNRERVECVGQQAIV